MAKVTLQNLGTMVRDKRGSRGLRAVAAEIGHQCPNTVADRVREDA